MTRPMRPIQLGLPASLLVLLAVAGGASAQIVLRDTPKRDLAPDTPRWLGTTGLKTLARRHVLIDRDLRRIDASEVDIGPTQIRFRGANGRAQSVDASSIVAMLPADAIASSAPGSAKGIEWREIADATSGPQGRVELVDGQVIPGRLVEGTPKGETIAWEHAILGRVDLPMEGIARVVFKNDAKSQRREFNAGEPSNDVVLFTNGDVAKGVVESISIPGAGDQGGGPGAAEAGQLMMDIAGKAFQSPLSRIAAVAFANPKKVPNGVFAWLRDGTVIGGTSGELGTAGLTLQGVGGLVGGVNASRTIAIPWDEVVGLNTDVAGVVPLASLAMSEVKPGEGREWAIPPKVEPKGQRAGGVGEIELFGPISVAWTMPAGVRLVALTASLHPAARMLGDCVLVVECGGEIVRQRLNGEKPIAEVRLTPSDASKAGTLRVTIESGEGGSIQDRVVLRRAMVEVGK